MRLQPTVLALGSAVLACTAALAPSPAAAFCGFYVASGDAKIFNRVSQVVIARDGDRTVITLSNDFRGEPKAFAMVVPVPVVIRKNQVHIGDRAWIERLDAYSAPRLVEYFDPDPCPSAAKQISEIEVRGGRGGPVQLRFDGNSVEDAVRIEDRYKVDEYEIVILSATEGDALERWLRAHGYRIPAGAGPVLDGYVKQGTKFFVAKVDLAEHARLGFSYLRPIQVAFESPKFALPIRLGMANADGAQELFVYTLTRKGRVETVNYRTLRLPTGMDLPPHLKREFPDFVRAMFSRQVDRHDMSTVFTEYAWEASTCDPCPGPPLTAQEMRSLGAFWIAGGDPAGTFVTRLHVRYDAAHFPEDLVFQETADRTTYQARYVLRHPWAGTGDCPEARRYRASLAERRQKEARALSELTGWKLGDIRSKMAVNAAWEAPTDHYRWWDGLWKR